MKYKLLRFSLLSMLVMFFGGLAYAQDEPDVTLDFTSQDNWDIPTSGTNTTLAEFTDGTYTIKLCAKDNYKLNSGYLLLGKEGSFLQLPEVDFDVAKIEVVGTSGASASVTQTITNGNGALVGAAETTGAKNVTNVYELTDENQKARVYRILVTNNYNTQISKVFIYKADPNDTRSATTLTLGEYQTTGEVGGTIDLPTVTVATVDGTPVEGATVEWSCSNEEVAQINGATLNLLAVGEATITATFAGNDNYKGSKGSFKVTVTAAAIDEPFTSLQALQEAVTSTSTPVTIKFTDVFVTAVKGNNAFLADAQGYGILVYQKDHGLVAGQVLNGTINANLVLYRGQTEITGFSTEGLTITTTELTPTEKTIDAITAANQSTLVTLKGVTFSNGKLSDGTNEITYYDNFGAGSLEEGKTYDITGIVILFNTTLEICPRTADDVVAIQQQEQWTWRNFAVNLTDATIFDTSVNNFGVKVAEDGTYTAVTADDATANFSVNSARFNDSQHGWVNCVFTVPVTGAVKIELGDCQYGGQNGTIVDAEGNSTDIKANATKKCWSPNAPHENVVVAYYAGTAATTLTISYNGYCPFIAVTSIDPSEIPNEATVTFDVANAGAEGLAPAAQKVEIGTTVTIPANTTLYKEGYTLTAWVDAADAQYTAGQQIAVSADITLLPVFTENAVAFADRTAETTLVWQFGESNGAGTLNAQGKKTILVTQATIGNDVIDVKMDIDATNGKINNVGRGDEWAQCNDGTILTIPAYKGTQVSFRSYGDAVGTTIGGVEAENKAATYSGTAETLDIVAKGISYISNVTAVYPVPAADEEKFVDIKADFTNGSFFTANETSITTAGLKMNADGTFTRVAADDPTANAVITGKYHSDQHGLANFSATVQVLGTVKVSMGSCAWGGDVTVKNAEGQTVATFNTNNGACWSNSKPDENVLFAYYKVNEPTTLTISGGAYTPYFAVEAVSPEQIPNDVKFIFDVANSGAEGVAPADETVAIGKNYTLPKNFTLYKEGYTLTGWTDGQNTYAPGETITAPDAESVTLFPIFTENEVNLNDRTGAVTVKWNFRRDAGAPSVQWQNKDGLVWVAQATVAGKTIDVALPFSTNPGKFANGNWTDWAQLNNGTTFHVPSCKGATISMEAYSEITTTTIDGQTDYTSGKTISYTIAGAAESVDVVIGDGSYYRYIQVVLPVVQSQGGGESYDNADMSIEWPMMVNGNVDLAVYTATPNAAVSVASFEYTPSDAAVATGSRSKDPDNGLQFVTFTGENVQTHWFVKPAAGLTFTPTQIRLFVQRFGTNKKDGVVVTAKVGDDGEVTTLGTFTARRANFDDSQEEGQWGEVLGNLVNEIVIDLTEAQQTALASGEGLHLFATTGLANNKAGGFNDCRIYGKVNGTVADVNKYTLATVVSPEEAGSINVYPKADEYEEGSEVTLTANENFGYDFVNWTNAAGEEVSTEAKFKYTMNSNETLTANFVAVETFELALTVDGTNDYMVSIEPAPTMVDGKMMYEAGQAVQLTANQYEGLVTFTNWSDGETNSSKLISMTDNIQLTAMYAQVDIIAGWDFYKAGSNGRKADFAAQDNDADALNLVNTETGETSGWLDKSWLGAGGYESFKGAAVNWRTGSGNGDVGHWHWQTKVNAEAFTDINVQFQMLYNYNAYQTYNAEYSLDGENWTKFGSITMTGTKQAVQFNELMPAEANNQKDLYIRMLADKTSNVDGAASANDGNTLAMFFITGTPKLVNDGKAPELVSTVPVDGATGVSASGKIVLTFDERVKLADGAVAYINNIYIKSITQNPTPGIVSGKTITFEYKGLDYATEYHFVLAGKTVADLTDNYVAEPINISFTTMERPTVNKKMYDYVVGNVDDLMAAIAAAQARSDKNMRYRIFIKNGEYTIPLSSTMKTVNGYEVPECITFINTNNVSFIGESRDGVIITNGIDKNATFAGTYGTTSKYDGIGNSDVFQISGQGYYWQDLTVESGMDDATGRDLAIHDKGTQNIYKNVGLRGYQDTWTSNNDRGLYYFEDGYVRGRTDYMCGKGDIFWNRVELRQIAGGYAAVPSKPKQYGWVYKDCVINGEGSNVDGNYTLGRPWGSGTPIALFIDTKMNVVPSAIGWNEMSGGWPARFAEYNSMTSTGSVIDLSGRKKIFGDGHENNPVLTAEEALEAGNLHNMFGDWDPTVATEQAPTPKNVELAGNELTWAGSNYALLFAIVKDGAVVDFTLEPQYTVDDPKATWAVRAANEMGGLSEAATATVTGLRGDVNGDGQVGIGDIVTITNYMAGDMSVDADRADVNGDGQVGIGDIVTITNIMAGIE